MVLMFGDIGDIGDIDDDDDDDDDEDDDDDDDDDEISLDVENKSMIPPENKSPCNFLIGT